MDAAKILALIGAVEEVKARNKDLSDRAACKILAEKHKYVDAPWRREKRITPAALYNRLREALKIVDQLTDDALEEYPALLGPKKPS